MEQIGDAWKIVLWNFITTLESLCPDMFYVPLYKGFQKIAKTIICLIDTTGHKTRIHISPKRVMFFIYYLWWSNNVWAHQKSKWSVLETIILSPTFFADQPVINLSLPFAFKKIIFSIYSIHTISSIGNEYFLIKQWGLILLAKPPAFLLSITYSSC